MTRVFSILVFASVLVLGACNGSASSDEQATRQEGEPVRVQDFRLVETSSGERQVMGTLHNTTSKVIGNAQIKVALYDANNVQVETMNVNVSDIPAAGEVQFKKPLTTGKKVQGARVQSVLVM